MDIPLVQTILNIASELDPEPQYQPLPWIREVDNGYKTWKHDCSEHHAKFDGSPPVRHGYDARDIKDRSRVIRHMSLNQPDTAMQFLQYEILSEYLQTVFENVSIEQCYSTFEAWAALLDQYFFGGFLTQGPEKLINLRVYLFSAFPIYGLTSYSIGSEASRIAIILRDDRSGNLFPKIRLFDTLLHEMCHAYGRQFYNFCPVNGDPEVEYDARGGHGRVWRTIYYNACEVLSRWHPAFSFLDRYPKPVLRRPAVRYRPVRENFRSILHRTVHDRYGPTSLHMRHLVTEYEKLHLENGNPELMTALISLRYVSFKRYLLLRLPFEQNIEKAVLVLSVVLFCLLVGLSLCLGYLGEFLALLCYGYMVAIFGNFSIILLSRSRPG
ncbi:hypothetical protein F5Y12DRAFT_720455 [Xylaria sp. FL1777]|nr:hypothetical protein F5Y12DRAFT_720455 [Xylaria sp. FL1777]